MSPPYERRLQAVPDEAAPATLDAWLAALARCLATAVGAEAALVTTIDDDGRRAEGAAGPMSLAQALQRAAHTDERDGDDVVIRYVGVSASFGRTPPKGAVLAVVPGMDDEAAAHVTAVVQAFAELAELFVPAPEATPS